MVDSGDIRNVNRSIQKPGEDAAELLSEARRQVASVTKEFWRGLSTVNDPVQRGRLAAAYTSHLYGEGPT